MNTIIYIIIGATSLGLFSQLKTNSMVANTETPKYDIVESFEKFEIRKYPKMILASTKIEGNSYSKSSNQGFNNVASYIFGGNDENQKISMTSPVISSIDDSVTMSFIMPAKYKINDLPNPNNNDVNIKIQEERYLAIIKFSGFANDYDIKFYTKVLKDELKKENISSDGQVLFQGYDPPFKLFNRKNEIAIEIPEYSSLKKTN